MRINSYLAKSGLGSRRHVERYIIEGRVLINGQKAKLHSTVNVTDEVLFNNKKIGINEKLYYLVNKPVGYVSTVSDEHANKKVVDLVGGKKLFPVGRLDKDSEGLVILTNDGDFAQRLSHPKYEHEKEYLVEVKLPRKQRSQYLENAIKFFKCGVILDNKKTKPSQIKIIAQNGNIARFNIVLKEGVNRQIRKTFAKAKLEVSILKRIRIGEYTLGDLKTGETQRFYVK